MTDSCKILVLLGLLVSSLAGAADVAGPWMGVYQAAQTASNLETPEPAVAPAITFAKASTKTSVSAATPVLLTFQKVQSLSRMTIWLARMAARSTLGTVILPDGKSIEPYAKALPERGAILYRVTYRSVDAKGAPTVLSGLVALPAEDGAPTDADYGLVVYMHSTTAQRSNAASDRSVEAYGAITAFGGEGWVLAMPDYLGYGANNQPHPYALGKLNAQSGISMILAARELMKYLGRSMGSQINITGYSEGGGNALWLGRALQERYAADPLMKPTRIAPMSGPYDLSRATANSFIAAQPSLSVSLENFSVKPTLLAFAGVAVADVTGQPLWSLLQTPLADQADGIFPGPYADDDVGARILTVALNDLSYVTLTGIPHPENMLQPQLINAIASHDTSNPAMKLWAQNDNVSWTPTAPVYLLGVIQDALVPFAASTYVLPAAYVREGGLKAPYSQGNAQSVIKAMRARKIDSSKVGWLGFDGLVQIPGGKPTTTMSHSAGFEPCVEMAAAFFRGKTLSELPRLADPK
jgi:hypothetical protein